MILNQNRVESTHKIREPMNIFLMLKTMLWKKTYFLTTKKAHRNDVLSFVNLT